MDKRFSWIFLLASAVFFVFIVGLTGYRIENVRVGNTAAAQARLPGLAEQIRSMGDSTGGYDAPQFKEDARGVFDAEPRLLLLCVHSPDEGILYFVARNRSYLKEPSPITPDWRGTPVYQVSRGYEVLLSQALDGTPVSPTMDALFVVMGREDLYPVLRDDLFLFLAFLLVCGVLILIMVSVQQDTVEARPPTADPPRPASVTPRTGPPAGAQPREPQGLTSPRTGLVWADHLGPRLEAELERATAADQDLAIASICIDDSFPDAKLPLVHAGIAKVLRDSFPLHDLIFEAARDSYIVLLPDTDLDTAVRSLEAFRMKVAGSPIEGKTHGVSIGVSSRGGRLLENRTLLEEANVSLAKASREGGNRVIGFRADPARFRDTLTGARA